MCFSRLKFRSEPKGVGRRGEGVDRQLVKESGKTVRGGGSKIVESLTKLSFRCREYSLIK